MENKIKTILLVEDEAIIAMALAAELEDAGFEIVDIVSTGTEALALILQRAPDLVILDVKLGDGMNGLDTLLEIRKIANPHIFIVSGNSDAQTAKQIETMQVNGFFVKPVHVRSLLQHIQELTQ